MNTMVSADIASTADTLAIHGGIPSAEKPRSPRVRWGEPELLQLARALEQESLFYWNGAQTKLLVERFQKHYPLEYVMPCSSGTAALHIAVAAAGVGPGDEVITSPITDMGTVIGVLYQGGVPVFADLDPGTYNLDIESVHRCITPKTKAIIAVHLAGNPCALYSLEVIAEEHGLILIEDCAQAWGAMYRGHPIGTIGHIGCWSLNDFKHIGCGDGGIVATYDKRFGPLLQKFGDKAYDRSGGARMPETLAPNYRISELQSAVAVKQMERMWDVTARRGLAGLALNEALAGVPGILPPRIDPRDRWTAWFYLFRIDSDVLCCTNSEFAVALSAEGVNANAGYIPVPLYEYPVFQNHNFFHGSWPVRDAGLTHMDYRSVRCANAETILGSCVQVPLNETMDEEWVGGAALAIKKVAAYYCQ